MDAYAKEFQKPIIFGQIDSDTTNRTYAYIALALVPPKNIYVILRDLSDFDTYGDGDYRTNLLWVEGGRLYYTDRQHPKVRKYDFNKAFLVGLRYASISMSEISDTFGYSTHEKINPHEIPKKLIDNLNFAVQTAVECLNRKYIPANQDRDNTVLPSS